MLHGGAVLQTGGHKAVLLCACWWASRALVITALGRPSVTRVSARVSSGTALRSLQLFSRSVAGKRLD